MTCWRCGRADHADWCSDGTPNDCTHCGGNPCRWWCLGGETEYDVGRGPGLWRDEDGGGSHGPRLRVMEPA